MAKRDAGENCVDPRVPGEGHSVELNGQEAHNESNSLCYAHRVLQHVDLSPIFDSVLWPIFVNVLLVLLGLLSLAVIYHLLQFLSDASS